MAFKYNNYGLIVSIDFGTTFSGTCYAITGKLTPKQLRIIKYPTIIHITNWPDQSDQQSKTPSINIYDRNFHLLHWGMSAQKVIKGGNVKDGHRVIEKFKLELPSSIAQKGAIHKTGSTSQGQLLNMRATIDYFREIFDHTISTMQAQAINIEATKGIKFEKENIRFVITVPAQWNDVQRAIMRNVAKEAGLISEDDHENRLLVINESLAATLYCERKNPVAQENGDFNVVEDNAVSYTPRSPTDPNSDSSAPILKKGFMAKGEKYMICDAGGGTVDLAVFESTDHGDDKNNDSFRRCQLTADSGKKCGSVFLDLRMKNLFLFICFGAGKSLEEHEKYLNDNESEKKILEELISALIEDFLSIKIVFGKRSDNFKFPPCPHLVPVEDQTEGETDDECEEDSDEEEDDNEDIYDALENRYDIPSDDDDSQDTNNTSLPCEKCYENDYQYVQNDDFGDSTIFITSQSRLLGKLNPNTIDGVEVTKEKGRFEISISYKCMRENIFDDVINNTLELLERQIMKANGGITRTYLVGGFGGSPYLRKRIKEKFGPDNTKCCVGDLVYDERGDTAAMRGALIYGIDGSKKEPQSDVVEEKYKYNDTAEYNTLVCLDIGYNGTACSYRDLTRLGDEMSEIINWPGLDKENFIIPTAKEKSSDGKIRWGAEVTQTTNLDPELLIVPSELMSIVKSDFRSYLSEYIKLVFDYVYGEITKNNPNLTDKSKYRYVITMENCYQFFNNKSEMRRIAQLAGIISAEDPVERLLLIRRDDAAALYFEKTTFTEKKAYSNHFLQISVYHDICHLSLHEFTKISGYDTAVDNNPLSFEKISTSNRFRNVRSMRSATFVFNFVAKLVANLDSFISNSVCISCKNPSSHDTYSPTYYAELRDGFLEYMKNNLDFDNSDKTQKIIITKSKCCEVSITIYDLLEHVFRPACRDLASEINRFATQVDMSRLFNFDKVFLSGFLLQAKEKSYRFLEKIILKNISDVMNIHSELIIPSNDNGKEALIGAAHYGNFPEDFTERVSRKSYVIQVRGFKRQEFNDKVKNNILKIDKKNQRSKKHDVYNEEAANALIDEARTVQLYHQSSYNPSLKNNYFIRTPQDATFLIHRGDKITEHNQMHGISKRFYAEEECIVYATIYYSEDADLPKDEIHVDLAKFNKIHQFEIYVKRDLDDPMTVAPDSRLHFDVRVIPDNNEAKFEAIVGSRLGSKIPEFRFRDEILVANIYGDEEQIKVEDLTISKDEKIVADLAVRKTQ